MPNVIRFSPTGQAYTDGLLSGTKWATTSLTISFPELGSLYGSGYGSGENTNGFKSFSPAQRSAAAKVLDAFQSVTNLSFTPMTQASAQHADIRFGASNDGATGWAYMPSPLQEGGDVWLNASNGYYNSPVKGNYAQFTLLHEVGHALGLKHAHEQQGMFKALPSDHDSMEYSVMSYRSYQGAPLTSGYSNETWGYAQSLMMDDIAALQSMYGADYTTNSGNSTYKWSATSGEMSINGVGQGAPGGNQILLTVWDGGGADTYDLSNYAGGVRIDLTPGGWTKTSSAQLAELRYDGSKLAVGNIANARLFNGDSRSLIENATGGAGNDVLVGNTANNALRGGGGNDVLTGSAGADNLWGGSGADRFDFNLLSDSRAKSQGRDLIRDFDPRADCIDLSTIDADIDGTAGNQAFKFIGTGAFSGGDGELRYAWADYAGTADDRTLVSGDVDGGASPDFQIAMWGLHVLTAGDFIL